MAVRIKLTASQDLNSLRGCQETRHWVPCSPGAGGDYLSTSFRKSAGENIFMISRVVLGAEHNGGDVP